MRETSTICRAGLCHRVSKFPLSPFFLYSGYMKVLFLVSSYEESWQSGPGNCVVNVENTSPFWIKFYRFITEKLKEKVCGHFHLPYISKISFSLAVIAFISEEKGLGLI